jgi:hypothetical protein
MTRRWTYQVIEIKPAWTGRIKPQAIQDELNRLGLQGWELASTTIGTPMGPALAALKKEL